MIVDFVGDVMLGENLYHQGRGIRSRYGGCYGDLVGGCRGVPLGVADWIVFNLEGVLEAGDGLWPGGCYAAERGSLGVWPRRAQLVACVANNHFCEHGREAAEETIRILEEEGVRVVGRDGRGVTLDGGTSAVRVWAVSCVPCECRGRLHSWAPSGGIEDVLDWGEKKRRDETWVVIVHWGREYHGVPEDWQRAVVRRLQDRGVDVVIGHHPHIIQEVEEGEGKLAAYSLGNFLFDQNFSEATQTGLIVEMRVDGGERTFRYWLTRQGQDYAIADCRRVDAEEIRRRAAALQGRTATWMRMAMKLELVRHWRDVPGWVAWALVRRALAGRGRHD